MTAPEELYAAILADPDDMELRLRYADAVEGIDPEHAELIRLQIESDQLRMAGSSLRPGKNLRKEELEEALAPRLGAAVAGLVSEWGLRRGFAELVELTGQAFLANGAEIYRRVPVRHVILRQVDAALMPSLAASPLLTQLASLSLAKNPIGDDGVAALLDSPYLKRLRWLSLYGCGIGTEGAEEFARLAPETLPSLKFLRYGRNPSSLVPYGEGQDAVSGRYPVDVYTPPIAEKIISRNGPLPWLDEKWAWRGGFVDFGEI